MKKLIFRKFTIDFLLNFLISITIVGLIVLTIQAVNYFDYVTQDGHGLKIYFFYTLLNFPKIIYRILPFIFFVSLFFTIIKYETSNELNIFWINGISKIKFTNIVLKLSIILMLIQIFLASFLAPLSQFKAREIIKNSNISFLTNLMGSGKFINAISGLTIFIEEKNDDRFFNIFINDTSKGFTRAFYSKRGILTSEDQIKKFVLFDGKVLNIDDNRINAFTFDQITFGLQSYTSNSIIKPKIQETETKVLLDCVLNKSNKVIKNCDDDNFFNEIKQELTKRFFKPFYIPLVALICCLLFFTGKYKKNYNKVKIFTFLSTVFVLLISETSLRYSGGTSNLLLFAIIALPIAIFSIVYMFFYLKVNNA